MNKFKNTVVTCLLVAPFLFATESFADKPGDDGSHGTHGKSDEDHGKSEEHREKPAFNVNGSCGGEDGGSEEGVSSKDLGVFISGIFWELMMIPVKS